ncbi:MAG TPA: ester cyclase, partial [Thermomicrobiales bacterium]
MSIEANKAVVSRMFDAVNANDIDGVIGLATDDFVVHTAIPNVAPGRAGFRTLMEIYFGAFTEQHVDVDAVVAEGDRVVVYHTHHLTQGGPFAGLPPSGKQVVVEGLEMYRVVDGKIAEMWHH